MAEAEGGLSDDNIDRNSEDEDMADDSSDSSDDEHQWTKEVFFIQSVGYGSSLNVSDPRNSTLKKTG